MTARTGPTVLPASTDLPVILLTGFGAFPGAPSNPSSAIVRGLGHGVAQRLARFGVRLERRIFPVEFAGAAERLDAVLMEARPAAVLHIGLAGRRKTLGVETRARNFVSGLHPDALKRHAERQAIQTPGPLEKRARVPAARLVSAMARAGVRAEPSNDAGSYACNQTLYLTLGRDIPVAGFIHIPRPRGRRPRHQTGGARRPTLAGMSRAIEAALVVLAVEVRRSKARKVSVPSP